MQVGKVDMRKQHVGRKDVGASLYDDQKKKKEEGRWSK
jgi:hypothetical protein